MGKREAGEGRRGNEEMGEEKREEVVAGGGGGNDTRTHFYCYSTCSIM